MKPNVYILEFDDGCRLKVRAWSESEARLVVADEDQAHITRVILSEGD